FYKRTDLDPVSLDHWPLDERGRRHAGWRAEVVELVHHRRGIKPAKLRGKQKGFRPGFGTHSSRLRRPESICRVFGPRAKSRCPAGRQFEQISASRSGHL